MTFDTCGTCYEYLETPDTIPIVLVHGVGLDQHIWGVMLDGITGRSTLTYDLLGHGETTESLGAQSFQPFVTQLHGLLRGLGIMEMILAGFSLGGQVAKHFASAHPELVRGLVLVSTTYQRTAEERAAMSSRLRQAKNGDQQALEAAALQRWFNPEFLTANPAVERQITSRLQNNDPAKFLESYELLSNAEDHPVDYRALSMPTLVLTGDGDPGSTPRMANEMARAMTNSRAEIVEGAKHLGIIEHHQRFSSAINTFMAETGL